MHTSNEQRGMAPKRGATGGERKRSSGGRDISAALPASLIAFLLLFADARVASSAGCGADLDGDRTVGGGDIGQLLAGWGGSNPALDVDGDGVVGGGDLGILLGAWGPVCAPECGGDPLCDPACGGDPAKACCGRPGITYAGSAYMVCTGFTGSWPKGLSYCCGNASDSAEAFTRPGQSILDLPAELMHTYECLDMPIECLNEFCQSPSVSEGTATAQLQQGGTPQQFSLRHEHTLHGTAQAFEPCFAGAPCTPTELCFVPETCSFEHCIYPTQLGCGAYANIYAGGLSELSMTFTLAEPSLVTLQVSGGVECEESGVWTRQTSVWLVQVQGVGEAVGILPAGQHQLTSSWGSSLASPRDGCPVDFDGTCTDSVLVTMKVEPVQCIVEADCDDCDPCTIDCCLNGQCGHYHIPQPCAATLDPAAACPGGTAEVRGEIVNTGGCPAEFSWTLSTEQPGISPSEAGGAVFLAPGQVAHVVGSFTVDDDTPVGFATFVLVSQSSGSVACGESAEGPPCMTATVLDIAWPELVIDVNPGANFAQPSCSSFQPPASAVGGTLNWGAFGGQGVGVLDVTSDVTARLVPPPGVDLDTFCCAACKVGFVQNVLTSSRIGSYSTSGGQSEAQTEVVFTQPGCTLPLLDVLDPANGPYYPCYATTPNCMTSGQLCGSAFTINMEDYPGGAQQLQIGGKKLDHFQANDTFVTWLVLECPAGSGAFTYAYHWNWQITHDYTLTNNNGASATVAPGYTACATVTSHGPGQGGNTPVVDGMNRNGCACIKLTGFVPGPPQIVCPP